jgi:hypothetical protein
MPLLPLFHENRIGKYVKIDSLGGCDQHLLSVTAVKTDVDPPTIVPLRSDRRIGKQK